METIKSNMNSVDYINHAYFQNRSIISAALEPGEFKLRRMA